jgi:hypothetical protein
MSRFIGLVEGGDTPRACPDCRAVFASRDLHRSGYCRSCGRVRNAYTNALERVSESLAGSRAVYRALLPGERNAVRERARVELGNRGAPDRKREPGVADAPNDSGTRIATVKIRQHQAAFRRHVLRDFNQGCSLSTCRTVELLEAAHIRDWSDSENNQTANGLALRRDLHRAFDLHLFGINPDTLEVRLSVQLADDPSYLWLHGLTLLPAKRGHDRRREYLRERWTQFLDAQEAA